MFDTKALSEATKNKFSDRIKKLAIQSLHVNKRTSQPTGEINLVTYNDMKGIRQLLARSLTEAVNNIERQLSGADETVELGFSAREETKKLTLKQANQIIEEKSARLAELSAELSKDDNRKSPLSVFIDCLRDNLQSNYAAQVSMMEFIPVLPLYDNLGLHQIEIGGGRYGQEKPLDQGYFPSDYINEIVQRIEKTEKVALQRASVGNAFTRQTQEDLVALNTEIYKKSGAPITIRTFTSLNHIDDMQSGLDAIDESNSRVPENKITKQAEIAIGVSDKGVYNLDFYVNKILDYIDSGADKVGIKDYSGVQEGFKTETNQVSASEIVREVKKQIPWVEFNYHNHNTAGRGVDSSTAAIVSGAEGATVNLFSSNDYGQPPAEQVANRLVDMQPEVFRPLNEAEKALAYIIQSYHESYIDVRNEKFKSKPVTEKIREGVKKTTAAGGGLAGVRKDLEEQVIFQVKTDNTLLLDENGKPKTTNSPKRLLTEEWMGIKPIAEEEFNKLSPDQQNKMALERLEDLYMKTLNSYKSALGDPSLVTPMYEYVSRLAVANIKNIVLTKKPESELENLEKIVLTPDVKDMIRGFVDIPPLPINKILVERVIRDDISSALNEKKEPEKKESLITKLKINPEQETALIDKLRNFGNNINSEVLLSKAVKDLERKIKNTEKRISENQSKPAKLEHFQQRLEKHKDELENANSKVKSNTISYDDYVQLKLGNCSDSIINKFKKSIKDLDLNIEDGDLKKLLSISMPNVSNPSDLLQGRIEIAKDVVEVLKKEGVKIPESKEQEALLLIASDPNVGLDKDGTIKESFNGVSKLKPVSFLRAYSKAQDFLKEKCDYFINNNINKNLIDGDKVLDKVLDDKFLTAFVVKMLRGGKSETEIHNQSKNTIENYIRKFTGQNENVGKFSSGALYSYYNEISNGL